MPADVDLEAYPKFAQEALDQALADAGAEASGVKVTTVVRKGQAADVLCAEAKGAELLVVGSRGLGGFRGSDARIGQPAVRPPRPLPARDHPERR